jgi:hypothetical protein
VIGELLANALQHTPGPIRLRLEVSDDHVRVQVHDALPHMVPGTLVGGLVPRPSGDRPAGEGGRGLILVAGLSDSWGVDSDGAGKVVWADLSAAGGW